MTKGICRTCQTKIDIFYDMIECVHCYNKRHPQTYIMDKNGDWCSTHDIRPLRSRFP